MPTPIDENFILKINTSNISSGSTSANQFGIPLAAGFLYNFSVDWGDGSAIQQYNNIPGNSFSLIKTYSASGEYNIKIKENTSGGFPRILFANRGDRLKVLEISNWGGVTWSSLADAFFGCSNLKITATDGLSARTGAVSNIQNAWRSCVNLTEFPLIDLSSCRNATGAWRNCPAMHTFANINLSNVTSFVYTWGDCGMIENFPAIDMRSMGAVGGLNCFYNSQIPTLSYTNMIKNLSSNALNNGVIFNAGNSTIGYSAQADYDNLTLSRGWNISDGGFVND